jgi:hypothetical protein
VSFVIPVLNDAARLRTCLSRLAECDSSGGTIEIIVADNGSSDGSAHVGREAGAVVIEMPGVPVSELRNRGARVASGDVLAFVDADHLVDSGWITAALDALQSRDVAIAGCLYSAPDNGTWIQRSYDALRGRVPGRRRVEWLGSGNMAVWRRAFDWLGGFDTTLGTCEDVDLCRRARATGWLVMSDDRLKSVHLGDPSTLQSVFRGELWRGRDNLKVSLREPWSLRGLPSILLPVADLTLLTVAAVGAALVPSGFAVSLVALAATAAPAGVRAVRMTYTSGIERPPNLLQAFLVAYTYDIARAVALVARVGHATRHGESMARGARP